MKILCIPGGGSHVLAAARFLNYLENDLGPLHKVFDLICGTSAGALVGAQIATGVTAKSVVDNFKEYLPAIFPRVARYKFWRGTLTAKYSRNSLEEVLRTLTHGCQLSDCETKFMANALEVYPVVTPKFWKSWRAEDADTTLLRVLLATTAAPGLFSPFENVSGNYLDGALSTNDLSACALAEAVRLQGGLQGIKILNVCSSETGQWGPKPSRLRSPLGFVAHYPGLSVAANQALAEYQAHSLIGFNNHVVKLGIQGPIDRTGDDFVAGCEVASHQQYGLHRDELLARFGGDL